MKCAGGNQSSNMCVTRENPCLVLCIYTLQKLLFTSVLNLIEEEIDGEAFILMAVEDIVSMVRSKGAQLKMMEKKRQLSCMYPAVTSNSCATMSVSKFYDILVGSLYVLKGINYYL